MFSPGYLPGNRRSARSLAGKIERSVRFIRKRISRPVDFSILLGSGFRPDRSRFKETLAIPYEDVHLIKPSVKTHQGVLRFGVLGGMNVLLFQGRVHAYEGYAMHDVAFNAWVASRLSRRGLVLTSLVGGVNARYRVGDFVLIRDHINLSQANPLIMHREDPGPRFIDMVDAYDGQWSDVLFRSAARKKIRMHRGVLAYLTGPSFETRAELRFLARAGADIVGWSVVPEAIAARQLGARFIALSCVSDTLVPRPSRKADLHAIWEAGRAGSGPLFEMVGSFLSTVRELR